MPRTMIVMIVGALCLMMLASCTRDDPLCPEHRVLLLSGDRDGDFAESGSAIGYPDWKENGTYHCFVDLEHGDFREGGVNSLILAQVIDVRPYSALRVKAWFSADVYDNALASCTFEFMSLYMHPIRTEYFGLGPEPDGEARFLDIRIPIDENTPPDALLQFNLYAQIDSCIDESSRDCTGSAHGELGGIKVYGIY